MEIKQTPFTITNGMIEKIAEIAELTGRISAVSQLYKNPTLRRKNRIRTIYSSLAIEQNILTVEQVTAVLNRKHVLAPPKDIEEVKNAYEIYEILVESMIHKRQQQYYNAINYCNNACESTAFIEFMLEAIRDTLLEAIETTYSDEQVSEQVVEQDKLVEFCKEPRTRNEMQIFCGIEGRKKFNEKYLKPLLTSGKLAMTIPDKPNSKNQKYISSMK